jgi:hypothetical protein
MGIGFIFCVRILQQMICASCCDPNISIIPFLLNSFFAPLDLHCGHHSLNRANNSFNSVPRGSGFCTTKEIIGNPLKAVVLAHGFICNFPFQRSNKLTSMTVEVINCHRKFVPRTTIFLRMINPNHRTKETPKFLKLRYITQILDAAQAKSNSLFHNCSFGHPWKKVFSSL